MTYIGQKMSVRACEAYENGEKPLSKWTKTDIIDEVLKERKDITRKELNRYNKEALNFFLICSSWHHTGSYFNSTNFYSLNENTIGLSKGNIIEELNNRMEWIKQAKQEEKQAKQEENPQKCIVSYVEWEGTRKHPKAVNREAYGIIKGNWVYLEDCKKSLSGKYIRVVKKFDRSPRGTAQIFKNIEKGLRK